jgi:four helix bundle protein
LYQYLCNDKKEFVLSQQLLRSGTGVGAMVREAEHAETKADFKHKMELHKRRSMKPFIGLNY